MPFKSTTPRRHQDHAGHHIGDPTPKRNPLPPTPRVRQVYTDDMVAHKWAHKTQTSARNAHGNFYFNQETIYSYGEHFPIARHVTNARGEAAILITTESYSRTTSGQIHTVLQAIRGLPPQLFNVDLRGWGVDNHVSIMQTYAERFNDLCDLAARSTSKTKHYITQAQAIADERAAYVKFFNVKPRPKPLVVDLTAVKEKIKAQKKAAALAAKKRAAEAAKALAEVREHLPEWYEGVNEYPHPSDNPHHYVRINVRILPHAVIRPHPQNPELLQTSLGAEFPVEHGRRTWRILKHFRDNGGTYVHDGHTIHCGDFRIDSMGVDGIIHAGCHKVEWSEVARLAVQMGWTS